MSNLRLVVRWGQLVSLAIAASVLAAGGAAAGVGSHHTSPRPLLTYTVSRVSKGDHPLQHHGLCLANTDGSHAVQFAPFRRNGQRNMIYSTAAWSPNGKYVALFRGLYFVVADARWHVVRKLYNWSKGGYADRDPVWSPDGRWIAVVTSRLTAIAVLPASGRGKRTVAARMPIGAGGFESPSWTPDSKRIVFFAEWSSPSSGTTGIYAASRTGKNMHLVMPGANHRDPALSPDGTKLAFAVNGGDSGGYIAIANADGSNSRPLANPHTTGALSPAWSPDGNLVAYWRLPSRPSLASAGIVVAHADGSGEQLVVPDRSGFGASQPTWRRAVALPPAKRASCS